MSDESPCGILCLNKPEGITSHDAVNRIRRLYKTKKVGHTGTLDPIATGVLVVLIGRAVKASEYLLAEDKEYIASLILGKVSDTLDITGDVKDIPCSKMPGERELINILPYFTGDINQLPPMYSAIKIDGKKLYDLARNGEVIERESREIRVNEIEYLGSGEKDNEYRIRVSCSKGTYIRSLCADIGEKLGCGAVMSALCRTKNSHFSIENSYTLEDLENMSDDERRACLIDIEAAFSDIPGVALSTFFERLARCGNEIYLKKIGIELSEGTLVRLCSKEGFFALGRVNLYPEGPAIKPIKQFDI